MLSTFGTIIITTGSAYVVKSLVNKAKTYLNQDGQKESIFTDKNPETQNNDTNSKVESKSSPLQKIYEQGSEVVLERVVDRTLEALLLQVPVIGSSSVVKEVIKPMLRDKGKDVFKGVVKSGEGVLINVGESIIYKSINCVHYFSSFLQRSKQEPVTQEKKITQETTESVKVDNIDNKTLNPKTIISDAKLKSRRNSCNF